MSRRFLLPFDEADGGAADDEDEDEAGGTDGEAICISLTFFYSSAALSSSINFLLRSIGASVST
jgi:hypothetical protein